MPETTIRERPIIMRAESVRAILAGRKTQTRRVFPQARQAGEWAGAVHPDGTGLGWVPFWPGNVTAPEAAEMYPDGGGWKCPYGLPGDRLWVREQWKYSTQGRGRYLYRADGVADDCLRWGSPLFMPRKACRLVLEVVGVRVERLQSISTHDAIREGCFGEPLEPEQEFARRWDDLNAKRGFPWSANPWVWCVEFRRVEIGG